MSILFRLLQPDIQRAKVPLPNIHPLKNFTIIFHPICPFSCSCYNIRTILSLKKHLLIRPIIKEKMPICTSEWQPFGYHPVRSYCFPLHSTSSSYNNRDIRLNSFSRTFVVQIVNSKIAPTVLTDVFQAVIIYLYISSGCGDFNSIRALFGYAYRIGRNGLPLTVISVNGNSRSIHPLFFLLPYRPDSRIPAYQ